MLTVKQMTPEERAADIVKEFEGCQLVAYLCPAGVPTIGWGHTDNVKLGWECTQMEADCMLRDDLREASKGIQPYISVALSINQMAALISFAFNVGVASFANSTLRKRVNEGNHYLASREFLRWVYAKGKVLPGLVRRRQVESQVYMSS